VQPLQKIRKKRQKITSTAKINSQKRKKLQTKAEKTKIEKAKKTPKTHTEKNPPPSSEIHIIILI
jgi:hypothetical protein